MYGRLPVGSGLAWLMSLQKSQARVVLRNRKQWGIRTGFLEVVSLRVRAVWNLLPFSVD